MSKDDLMKLVDVMQDYPKVSRAGDRMERNKSKGKAWQGTVL